MSEGLFRLKPIDWDGSVDRGGRYGVRLEGNWGPFFFRLRERKAEWEVSIRSEHLRFADLVRAGSKAEAMRIAGDFRQRWIADCIEPAKELPQ